MIMTRARVGRGAVAVFWMAAIMTLLALGGWQVHRRAWKLDLIAHVDAGLKTPPVPAPATATKTDAYRRVFVSGHFLASADSFVQASTELGPGWWLLTPLRNDEGGTTLINRGFVADRRTVPVTPDHVVIHGLLRVTEPHGGFLRSNDAATDRWYSRDVVAIAARRHLGRVAPYFIDADSSRNAPGQPVGGLTVISFPNNHLVYALTFYMLALMSSAGFIHWIRMARRKAFERV